MYVRELEMYSPCCCRNGVELGEGYSEIAASLKGKEPS